MCSKKTNKKKSYDEVVKPVVDVICYGGGPFDREAFFVSYIKAGNKYEDFYAMKESAVSAAESKGVERSKAEELFDRYPNFARFYTINC